MGMKLDKLGLRALLPKAQPQQVKAKVADVAQKATGWLPKPGAAARAARLQDDFKVSGPPQKAVNPNFVPVDIRSQRGKEALIAQTSQVNDVSAAAGNGNSICSGAAIANALILSARTPDGLKKNVEALRNVAGTLGVPLQDGEGRALDHMAKGQMSPDDLALVQQLAYRVATAKNTDAAPKLAKPSDMALAATLLRGEGAFKEDADVQFTEAQLPGGGNHWTTFAGGRFASSLDPDGNAGTEIRHAPPEKYVHRGFNEWRGNVTVGQDASVTLAVPNSFDKNDGFQQISRVPNAEAVKGNPTGAALDLNNRHPELVMPGGNDPFKDLRRFLPD